MEASVHISQHSNEFLLFSRFYYKHNGLNITNFFGLSNSCHDGVLQVQIVIATAGAGVAAHWFNRV
jgi:hypothetical protein